MMNNELWIDTRLQPEEMNFLNVIITPSIKKNAENKEKEHVAGNVFRDELNFRASIGKGIDELHDENVWLSAEDWSTRVKEEDDRKMPEQS